MSFVKIERYFITNPGALFIIVFDVLILACAFLLILCICFLVVGVVLQAVAFLKDKNQGWNADEEEG